MTVTMAMRMAMVIQGLYVAREFRGVVAPVFTPRSFSSQF